MEGLSVNILHEPKAPFIYELPINATVGDVIRSVISDECLLKYHSIRIEKEEYNNIDLPLSETNASSDVTIVIYVNIKENEDKSALIEYLIQKKRPSLELLFILERITDLTLFDTEFHSLINSDYIDVVESFTNGRYSDAQVIECLFAHGHCIDIEFLQKWAKFAETLIMRRTEKFIIPFCWERYETRYGEWVEYTFQYQCIKRQMVSYGMSAEFFDEACEFSY